MNYGNDRDEQNSTICAVSKISFANEFNIYEYFSLEASNKLAT
jgi:hypothetical protein